MKKMTNIRQLEQAKKSIRNQEKEIKSKIKLNWNALKVSMQPAALVKETAQEIMHAKTTKMENESGILKNTLNYGLTLLVSKLTDNFQEKWMDFRKRKKRKSD